MLGVVRSTLVISVVNVFKLNKYNNDLQKGYRSKRALSINFNANSLFLAIISKESLSALN